MDLIYLDYNCFQRGFDDARQARIRMEALACEAVFAKAEEGDVRLVWSFMHEDETVLCPFPERTLEVASLSALCSVRIGPVDEIRSLALSFREWVRLSAKDAVHLACACHAGAQVFLTCDDDLLRLSGQLDVDLDVLNPVDYVRRKEADREW